jgi:tRNA pseudouridine55 synthase
MPQEKQKEAAKRITLPDIHSLISSSFTGKIMQTPPKYSALKIDGEKALFKAKAGEEFEITAREVEVFSFDIIDFSYPKLVCKAHVSSGTYIRSFAHDIGQKL